MDVYSFGVLGLWLLFEGIQRDKTDKQSRDIHDKGPTSSFKGLLESRVHEGGFLPLSLEVLGEDIRFDEVLKSRLVEFFTLTLSSDPGQRSDDFNHMLRLLAPDRWVPMQI